jgi:methanesulfonate monooxygenase small subunit
MNADRNDVEELVYESCMLLDQKNFTGFMDICTKDFEYKLSAWSPEIRNEMTWLDHDRAEMEDLFKTLPRHNTDASPLTRNAVVYKVKLDPAARRADVISSLQVFRTAANGGLTQLYAIGKYHDTVSLEGERPRLLARHVRLDTRDLGWGHHIPF